MASVRGRQPHPDYHEIPSALDDACALPTRAEEHQYLTRLIEEIEGKARLYSSLSGIAGARPESTALEPWTDDPALELLILHQSRRHDAPEPAPAREYGDILAAFADVKRAALLGAPGSGKSTTLRKLALELARRALTDPEAPLPLLVSLGGWTGDVPEKELVQLLCDTQWRLQRCGRIEAAILSGEVLDFKARDIMSSTRPA